MNYVPSSKRWKALNRVEVSAWAKFWGIMGYVLGFALMIFAGWHYIMVRTPWVH